MSSAVPRTKRDAIDRAKWREVMDACNHRPHLEKFTVEGRDGLMCCRCKLVLFYGG